MLRRPATTLLAIAALSSCAEPPTPELRIGLLAATGFGYAQSSGEPSIRGAEMAVDEINARGGVRVGGVRHLVRVVTRHYEARPDAAARAARALINIDSVDAIIGPQISAHAVPVSVIAEEVGLPMLSPLSSNPQTTAGKRFVFRLAFLDDQQGRVLGEYAAGPLGARRAAVLYDESVAYSASVANAFSRAFEARTGSTVHVETYTSDRAASFEDQLLRIRDGQPDVLLLPNPAWEDSIQMGEARGMGIDATFLGSDIWDLQRLMHLDYAQGAVVSHHWHWAVQDSAVSRFKTEFEARYGRTPRTTAAMTYDAVRVMLLAIERAGTADGKAVADRLSTLSGYRGATGEVSFTGSGDPDRSIALSTIRNWTVEVLELVDPQIVPR